MAYKNKEDLVAYGKRYYLLHKKRKKAYRKWYAPSSLDFHRACGRNVLHGGFGHHTDEETASAACPVWP